MTGPLLTLTLAYLAFKAVIVAAEIWLGLAIWPRSAAVALLAWASALYFTAETVLFVAKYL